LTHDVSLLFFSQAGDRRDLHSFPTRRSSDLLLKSIPDLDAEEELYSIPGSPPDLLHPPEGDAFAIRNEFALAIDYKTQPPMFKVDRKSTRLNSSHVKISYAVFCLKKKK